MRHGEYERRRRALETQLREDLELLRAGYQAKLRALETLWLTSPEDSLPAASEPPRLKAGETLRLSETLSANETETLSETLPEPAAPARRRGQVLEDLLERFDELPEIFDQRDIVRLLGYTAPRATLYRAIGELLSANRIAMEEAASGPIPTRYRKLPEPVDEDEAL